MTSTTLSVYDRVTFAGVTDLFRVRPGDAPHQVRGKRFLQALLLLLLLGAVATAAAMRRGHHVLGTTSEIPWGVLIATYVFFAVSSTGLCLVSSLGHIFGFRLFAPLTTKAVFLALVVMLIGFGVIATELESPLLLLKMAILSPNPRSPIWWMGMLYSLYLTFMTIELYFLLTHNHRASAAFSVLKLVAAVAASSNLGAVFGLLHARSYWYGSFTPLYIIATALVSGAALLVLVVYLEDYFTNDKKLRPQNEALLAGLGKLLALFLTILLFFVVWRTIGGVAGEHEHRADVTLAMLAGPLFFSFWFFEVALGIGVPLALLLGSTRRKPAYVAAAGFLPLLGMFVVRYNFVYAGQMFSLKPLVGRLGETIHYGPPFKGNVAGFLPYTPSVVEVGIVGGAVAAAIVLFVAGARALKLNEEASR